MGNRGHGDISGVNTPDLFFGEQSFVTVVTARGELRNQNDNSEYSVCIKRKSANTDSGFLNLWGTQYHFSYD